MQNFKKFLMEASDSTQVKDLQSDGFFFSVNSVTFGAESNFYRAICKFNRNPWADEDYKFHSEKPDDASVDYMLKNGELPK